MGHTERAGSLQQLEEHMGGGDGVVEGAVRRGGRGAKVGGQGRELEVTDLAAAQSPRQGRGGGLVIQAKLSL